MRKIILLCSALLCGTLSAQNWALLNPDYKYNYSNDGTDTISDQIRVMDIDTLGVDSMEFQLNGVIELLESTQPTAENCWSNYPILLNAPQFLGGRLIRSGSNWWMIDVDTTLVRVGEGLGQQWTGSSGISGTVETMEMITILGEMDSVKWMSFSNGVILGLSKEHGLIEYVRDTVHFDLIGIQGGIDLGERFPTMVDLFDYQPGDILEYRGDGSSTDGTCNYSWNYINRYEFVERTELPTRTEYLVQKTSSFDHTGYILWTSIPCGEYTYSTNTLISFNVEHDSWTIDNELGNQMLNSLWPGAYSKPDPNSEDGEFGLYYGGIRWRARKDQTGRYVLDSDYFDETNWESAPTVIQCIQDSLGSIGFDRETIRFVEGIGRTRAVGHHFEDSFSDSLWAYSIGNEHVGTPTSISVILGINSEGSVPLKFFPDPAGEHIQISNSTTGQVVRISDLNGRLVVQQQVTSEQEVIDVQALQPGAYVLMVDGFVPQRFMIVR
jgi:hypothetical protein